MRGLHLTGIALVALAGCDINQAQFFQVPIEGVPGIVHLGEVVPVEVAEDVLELGTFEPQLDMDGDGIPEDWNGDGQVGGIAAADDREAFFGTATTPGASDRLSLLYQNMVVNSVVQRLQSSVIYGTLGPTGSVYIGGATLDFVGTGDSVCIMVDPETASWAQTVSPGGDAQFAWPDNIYDDGDLDLEGGKAAFYTGTPGERMGDFTVSFADSLGQESTVDVSECIGEGASFLNGVEGRAGRGAPERCTFNATIPGMRYRVALTTFSLPIDDDQLSFGLLVMNGSCDLVNAKIGGLIDSQLGRECVITGESLVPGQTSGAAAAAANLTAPTWLGKAEAPSWPGSEAFEFTFCHTNDAAYEPREQLYRYCQVEQSDVFDAGANCSWFEDPLTDAGVDQRCYCGDIENSPDAGRN